MYVYLSFGSIYTKCKSLEMYLQLYVIKQVNRTLGKGLCWTGLKHSRLLEFNRDIEYKTIAIKIVKKNYRPKEEYKILWIYTWIYPWTIV